jgi:hypothetical protein
MSTYGRIVQGPQCPRVGTPGAFRSGTHRYETKQTGPKIESKNSPLLLFDEKKERKKICFVMRTSITDAY